MGRAGARRKLCPCGFVAWAAASLRLASAARGGHGDAGIERSRGDPMINADDRGLGAALARDRCCTHGGVSWNAFVGNSPAEPSLGRGPRFDDAGRFDWRLHPAFGDRQRRFEAERANTTALRLLTWSPTSGALKQVAFRHSSVTSVHALEARGKVVSRHIRVLLHGGLASGGGGVLLDIGAGLGVLAIRVAIDFPEVLVVATEPSPENYRYLVWNIRANGLAERIWPLNVAFRSAWQPSPVLVRSSPRRPWDSVLCSDRGDGRICGALAPSVPALTLAELLRRVRLRRVRWVSLRCAGCARSAAGDVAFLALLRESAEFASVELSPGADTSAVEVFCQAGRPLTAASVPLVCGMSPCSSGSTCARPWVWHTFADREWRDNELEGRCRDADFVEFEDAEALCRRSGARLCTADELQDCAADARWRCGLGGELVWSSSKCPGGGHASVRVHAYCTPGAQGSALECGRFAYSGRCCRDEYRGSAAGALQPPPRIFLLSSLSQDDRAQWPLLEHWLLHYRNTLWLFPKHFLLLLHSDSSDEVGLARRARWLWDKHGVRSVFPTLEPYSALRHMVIKWEVLQRYVTASDWVVQADSDEFVVFPGTLSASATIHDLDAAGYNTMSGLMVDRLALDGDVSAVPDSGSSIFEQYPRNCALTLVWQGSDIQKASAYKGTLRSTGGNHQVLGMNSTAFRRPTRAAELRRTIRRRLGERAYAALPESYKAHPKLPLVSAATRFATVYHFKWIGGLREKLQRRSVTEPDSKMQYRGVVADLSAPGSLKKELPSYCVGVDHEARGLSSKELVGLFMLLTEAKLRDYLEQRGFSEEDMEDAYDLAATYIRTTMAHETSGLPLS